MVKMKQSKWGGTHGSPGPRPPLVLCRRHVPAVLSGVVGQVGLVVGPVVGGLAGGGRTLLLSAGTLVWVTERLVQLMMVAHAHEPARGATHATRHRALEQKHMPQSAWTTSSGTTAQNEQDLATKMHCNNFLVSVLILISV